jgi:centromere-localized protein 2
MEAGSEWASPTSESLVEDSRTGKRNAAALSAVHGEPGTIDLCSRTEVVCMQICMFGGMHRQAHRTGVFCRRQARARRDATDAPRPFQLLVSTIRSPSSPTSSRDTSQVTPFTVTTRDPPTMPSPEAKLLSDFLLAPAALRDFMTLRQFTDIFPKAHRANPAVQDLYRELQRLREKDMDVVRRAIADEVARSKRLRREYASERRQLDEATVAGLDPVALRMEEEVNNRSRVSCAGILTCRQLSGPGRRKPHTLTSVHASIEEACRSLESHIVQVEDENAKALAEVEDVVGALSDLRHGRFAQPASGEDLGEEVLSTLKRLEAVCTDPVG